MKSKGPVDFVLGVFLEFGAAFCVLFFLPNIPWQLWELPSQDARRQLDFRPVEMPPETQTRLPASALRRAPILLTPGEHAEPAQASPEATQLHARYARPAVRSDFPRDYRY